MLHPMFQNRSSQKARPDIYVGIPVHLQGILLGICLLLLGTKNPLLSIGSVLVFPVLAKLTWRKGEPPVFFFGLAFQWFNMAMVVCRANILLKQVNDIYGSETVRAYWLTLIGILIIAAGIRMTTGKLQAVPGTILSRESDKFSTHKVFLGYLFFIAVIILLDKLTDVFWNLRSFFLALSALKWLLFFILTYIGIKYKKQRFYFYSIFALEFIQGLGSFFSDFKMPFMILFMVLITLGYRLPIRYLLGLLVISLAVLHVGVIWTAVKPGYRDFLNQGTGLQIVQVDFQSRLAKWYKLYTELSGEDYRKSAFTLAARVSVNGSFPIVLKRVPVIIPHANGERMMFALKHVFMPRILFPHKPVVDDSLITMRYTGSAIGKNTSIGVGYLAESYIDFGVPGMYGPLFIFGIILGWMHKIVISTAKDKFIGYIMTVIVFMNLWQYELGWAKMLGDIAMNFLLMGIILKFGGRMVKIFYTRSRKFYPGTHSYPLHYPNQ